jgi:hypothetical protein
MQPFIRSVSSWDKKQAAAAMVGAAVAYAQGQRSFNNLALAAARGVLECAVGRWLNIQGDFAAHCGGSIAAGEAIGAMITAAIIGLADQRRDALPSAQAAAMRAIITELCASFMAQRSYP